MLLTDETGHQLAAQFHLGDLPENGVFSIILDSAGGARPGQDQARNKDYALVLRLLLERLASIDAVLDDCFVESARTRDLPEDERRIQPSPWDYPVRLRTVEDFERLRLALTRPQGHIGSTSEAGGNERKRIRLHFRVSDWELTAGRLLAALRATSASDAEWQDADTFGGQNGDSGPTWREPPPATPGQGDGGRRRSARVTTKGESTAIERHAVSMATAYFQANGWSVRDVGTMASFDLVCTVAERVLHVEVKGTKGSASDITLYPNEVDHARGCEHELALFVVKDIEVLRTGDAVETAGGIPGLVMPWAIPVTLEATEYRCPVPTTIDWHTAPLRSEG